MWWHPEGITGNKGTGGEKAFVLKREIGWLVIVCIELSKRRREADVWVVFHEGCRR